MRARTHKPDKIAIGHTLKKSHALRTASAGVLALVALFPAHAATHKSNALSSLYGKTPAANRKIHYGHAPDWVASAPAAQPARSETESKTDKDSPARVVWSDSEQRITSSGTTTYSAMHIRLLRPEALQLGNLSLVWDPDTTRVTVNRLLVRRDGQVIDVLKDAKFHIYQREGGLEQAMLTGRLTANLQIPGLRVGDEIDFAQTQETRNTVFGKRHFDVMMLNAAPPPGQYRLALSWAKGATPKWRPSPDLAGHAEHDANGISLHFSDPGKFNAPDDAPAQFRAGRYVEYSDFANWADVSRAMYPLFAQAATIRPGSALEAEIARIRAASPDPRSRALAALDLVQDKVRYVYAGMDGGNYTPAQADDTWQRRFGDCKGKTALLMALLQGLGIAATPVLVNTAGGEAIGDHLPMPSYFNHAVVTLMLDGKRFWLDGTRQGEHRLLSDAEVPYRRFLPVTEKGSDLAALGYHVPDLPLDLNYVDIDASAGKNKPAKARVTTITRGDVALVLNVALSSMPHDAAVEALRRKMSDDWLTPDKIDWNYNAKLGTLTITATGTARLDWDDDGTTFYLPGGGFYKPDERKRPAGQDSNAPYANKAGAFSCSVTRMKMPVISGSHWSLDADAIDRTIGGIAYYRKAQMDHGVVSMVRASRTVKDQIPADQAKAANAQLPGFDNNKASVSQVDGTGSSTQMAGKPMADFDTVDWGAAPGPCLPARLREAKGSDGT